MRPAFRRGWVWGGKSGIVALARASGRAANATRGAIPLWEREGETLGVPAKQANGGDQPPSTAKRKATAPLHGATPAGRPARGPVGQRAFGQKRGKSASGSAHKCRTLRSAQRGTECVPMFSRSFCPAPDRHPNGPGLQARCARAHRAGRPKGSQTA